MTSSARADPSHHAGGRVDWRDCPAWLATAGMLASAALISGLGGEVWEQGWGPVLALGVMATIALLARRITWDVFWVLCAVNVLLKGAIWLFDTDGAWLLVVGGQRWSPLPTSSVTCRFGRAAAMQGLTGD
jgi:hypothetical protein